MNMRNEIAALKVMKEGGVAVPGAWAASEDNSCECETDCSYSGLIKSSTE